MALLGLSDGGITPPADVAAAAVADRVVELLAIHAELSAAAAAAAGATYAPSTMMSLSCHCSRRSTTLILLHLTSIPLQKRERQLQRRLWQCPRLAS